MFILSFKNCTDYNIEKNKIMLYISYSRRKTVVLNLERKNEYTQWKTCVSDVNQRSTIAETGNIKSLHNCSYYNGDFKKKIWSHNIMRAEVTLILHLCIPNSGSWYSVFIIITIQQTFVKWKNKEWMMRKMINIYLCLLGVNCTTFFEI